MHVYLPKLKLTWNIYDRALWASSELIGIRLRSSASNLHACAGVMVPWMMHWLRNTLCLVTLIILLLANFCHLPNKSTDLNHHWPGSRSNRCARKLQLAAIPLKRRPPIRENFNFWSLHSSACSLHASAGMIRRWMVHRMQKKIVPFDSSIQIF